MGCGCEQNEKPLKEALVITKNNLEDQAYNAIYNTPISFTYQNKIQVVELTHHTKKHWIEKKEWVNPYPMLIKIKW